jgi:hypothetical protein
VPPPTEPTPVTAAAPAPPVKLTPAPPPAEPLPVVMVGPPPPAPEERSLARSPWFWTAVAGAVLLAGGAGFLALRGRDRGGPSPSLGSVPGN